MVFVTTFVLMVGVMVVMLARTVKTKKGGVSTQRRIARRRIVRDISRGREERPVQLLHLTEEQWRSHAEAFADYCCGMGKYSNFTGVISDWLESEGLPPTPHDNLASTANSSEVMVQELHSQFWMQVAQERPQLAELARRQIEQGL